MGASYVREPAGELSQQHLRFVELVADDAVAATVAAHVSGAQDVLMKTAERKLRSYHRR